MTAAPRIALAAGLWLAATAHGHSILLEATPGPGATLPAPARVALRFNNRIEPALSRLTLRGPDGVARALAVAEAAAVDVLAAPLPALTRGTYRVDWRVLSTDGHVVTGSLTFTVVE